MRLAFALVTAAGAALMFSGSATASPPHRGGGGPRDGARLFVSPAGEVFRETPGAPPPIEAWFRQADANGDGVIGYLEFQADFRRAFATFDTDHDGEIGPEEVAHYETEIFPEIATRGRGGFTGGSRRPAGEGGGGEGMGRSGRGGYGGEGFGGAPRGSAARRGGGAYMMGGAARFGLLPISHPIMTADADFNRGVSRAEFDQAAATRFPQLDTAHNGRLTLEALIELRRHPPGG